MYIGGSACEAVGDFNRSLMSCYFVCVVKERASFYILRVQLKVQVIRLISVYLLLFMPITAPGA